MDLVGFKLINDSYGHFVGDQLLIEIGKRLLQMMNKKGIVARIGGG